MSTVTGFAFALALLHAGVAAAAEPLSLSPADVDPARPEIWRFDSTQSEARFRVRLFGIVPIGGQFDRLTGEVRVDRALGVARVSAELATDSVRMGRQSNTEWAKSSEFFDATRHPAIRFESEALPLARLAEGGVIEGALTLRGLTRPVAFELDETDCGLGAESTCRVDVSGQIDRSDFGMTTRRGTLADRVGLKLSIVAARAEDAERS